MAIGLFDDTWYVWHIIIVNCIATGNMNIPNPDELDHAHLVGERIRLLMKLRSSGIRDTAVLSAFEQIPRELFVPETFMMQAYEDVALPIALGQTISQPSVVAFMTQALEVTPRSRVLEIGTGSGYQAAILAKLARHVYTIERHAELHAQAKEIFDELQFTNIIARVGDGSKGWKEAAPFDRIMVTAGAEEIPEALLEQLAPNGRMIIPVGSGKQYLRIINKDREGKITEQASLPVRFVPLISN